VVVIRSNLAECSSIDMVDLAALPSLKANANADLCIRMSLVSRNVEIFHRLHTVS
jgi:hypothetical protein